MNGQRVTAGSCEDDRQQQNTTIAGLGQRYTLSEHTGNTQYHSQHGHSISRPQAFSELAPNNTPPPTFAHFFARVANNTLWTIV
jgi:hypothetical protein